MMPSQLCGRGKIWVCFPRFQQYIGMIVEVSELMQLNEQVNLCQQLAHLELLVVFVKSFNKGNIKRFY